MSYNDNEWCRQNRISNSHKIRDKCRMWLSVIPCCIPRRQQNKQTTSSSSDEMIWFYVCLSFRAVILLLWAIVSCGKQFRNSLRCFYTTVHTSSPPSSLTHIIVRYTKRYRFALQHCSIRMARGGRIHSIRYIYCLSRTRATNNILCTTIAGINMQPVKMYAKTPNRWI